MAFPSSLKWQIVFLIGFTAYFYSNFAQAANASESQPVMEILSPRHNAGTHWEGEVVKHSFEVKNTGSSELRILNVKPG